MIAVASSMLAIMAAASASPARQPPPRQSSALIRELGAAGLASRVRALRQIRATPRLLQDPQVGRAMAKILSADTDPLPHSSRIWRGPYNEDWAEFDASLAATLETNFGFADPDIARALVRASYQPQSAFAASIARQGGAVVPELEVFLARGVPTVKAQAIGVFGFMLADGRDRKLLHPLSAAQEDLVRRAVLAGARDKSLVVRDAAVQSLGFGGDTADIGLLRRIAATDPSCAQNPKGITLCRQTLQAIQKIEARAQRGPAGVR